MHDDDGVNIHNFIQISIRNSINNGGLAFQVNILRYMVYSE